jgi:hypothetical protein
MRIPRGEIIVETQESTYIIGKTSWTGARIVRRKNVMDGDIELRCKILHLKIGDSMIYRRVWYWRHMHTSRVISMKPDIWDV